MDKEQIVRSGVYCVARRQAAIDIDAGTTQYPQQEVCASGSSAGPESRARNAARAQPSPRDLPSVTPERVIDTRQRRTKGLTLAAFYQRIGDLCEMPHISGELLSLLRAPGRRGRRAVLFRSTRSIYPFPRFRQAG